MVYKKARLGGSISCRFTWNSLRLEAPSQSTLLWWSKFVQRELRHKRKELGQDGPGVDEVRLSLRVRPESKHQCLAFLVNYPRTIPISTGLAQPSITQYPITKVHWGSGQDSLFFCNLSRPSLVEPSIKESHLIPLHPHRHR